MYNFRVILLSQALKFYKTCPEELAARLNKCFKDLEKTPFFGPNIKLLKVQKKNKKIAFGDDLLAIFSGWNLAF